MSGTLSLVNRAGHGAIFVAALIAGITCYAGWAWAAEAAGVTIDYPADGSVFPPEFPPPGFLWQDAALDSDSWSIDVTFGDGSPALRLNTKAGRPRISAIDPAAVATINELPRLTAREAAGWTWRPDPDTWARIKRHSSRRPATITITGFKTIDARRTGPGGRIRIETAKEAVGAPVFYRDVPLMPEETEKGLIKPLAASALPLIAWRLRDIGKPESRLLLQGLHTCANCHSFSADGKTLGMDLDGPQNDKGLYALAAVAPRTSIRDSDVMEWGAFRKNAGPESRVGFMSQVSPDGNYVVTTVNRADYVANFPDFRFLQVFYPTRGVLAWYSRASGEIRVLPGADDPRYVQTGAVWSPDGRYLVFARAEAREPYPAGGRMPARANDPDELAVRFDLYRIPFNAGAGGRSEPIPGASRNGMSNTFPKVSPDGRWIVFVQCRNGQLMRPDSQLYIVPAQGGRARRMRCNTTLMNSWHTFSPNGRWLVFSSKSRSPYTQMFLTHIDEQGRDSPAILIENATAANRAVNIPEFVNAPPEGLIEIDVPAAERYRLFDEAIRLTGMGRYAEAVAAWRKLLDVTPQDARAHSNLGLALAHLGEVQEAAKQLREALEMNPAYAAAHNNLALVLSMQGRSDEALAEWRAAVAVEPASAPARFNLADALYSRGRVREATAHWRAGLSVEPNRVSVLDRLARVLATCLDPSIRDGAQAVALAERAVQLSGAANAAVLDTLAAAYAEAGRFVEAAAMARQALALAVAQKNETLAQALRARIALYIAHTPLRDPQ